MSEQRSGGDAGDTAREMREHEREARERDPDERSPDGDTSPGGGAADEPAMPGVQRGSTTST